MGHIDLRLANTHFRNSSPETSHLAGVPGREWEPLPQPLDVWRSYAGRSDGWRLVGHGVGGLMRGKDGRRDAAGMP